MDNPRVADLNRRLGLAETERRRYEPMWDDAIRLTMPGRKRFHSTNVEDAAEDIFDETGANAVEEFVSRMQAGAMPPFNEFVKLRASTMVEPEDRQAVNRDLDEIAEYAFEEIWRSNFAMEVAESLNDMAISTGTLLVEEGQGGQRLHHRSISMTDLHFESGYDGRIGGQFRTMEVKAGRIPEMYPRAKLEMAPQLSRIIATEKDRKVKLVEFTERKFSASGETCYHVVYAKDQGEIFVDEQYKGMGATPFISFRWGTAAGEVWGRGPLVRALGAVRTTNLMVELVLENAAMAIVGIYQTDNDATMNSDQISLLPGTILPKEPGTRGLEPIIGNGGDFNMRDVVLNDQRLNIKRALYNDMLADPNRTPASATEVVERMADLAYRTSAGFLRLHHELLVPYFMRVLHILEKRGDIEMPTKRGRALNFVPTSPLAQAQLARKIQTLFQDFQIRSAIFGPEQANLHYKFEELHPWLIEHFGLDESIYNTSDEVMKKIAETAQQMAGAMQQMQGMGQAEGAAGGSIQPGV